MFCPDFNSHALANSIANISHCYQLFAHNHHTFLPDESVATVHAPLRLTPSSSFFSSSSRFLVLAFS